MTTNRNSTTLFLTSPGATTPIPWVNNAPDLSGFTEPTLSVLTNAWQAFVDSGEELEMIPDPEPVEEPVVPNWTGFYDQLLISSTYQSLYVKTITVPSISGAMAAIGIALVVGKDDPTSENKFNALQSAISGLLFALNELQILLTVEQLAEIRGLLDANGFQEITLG